MTPTRRRRSTSQSTFSADNRLLIAILQSPVDDPSQDGVYWVSNLGSAQPIGTLYIDVNPGEHGKPIEYLQQQSSSAVLVKGSPPNATYKSSFTALPIPQPRTYRQILGVLNEGSLIQYAPQSSGVRTVPRGRRSDVLRFLGFSVPEDQLFDETGLNPKARPNYRSAPRTDRI